MRNKSDSSGVDGGTWAALLAHWTEFARASVALPEDGEGGRWKRAVPEVITLQSVTMALGELDRVDDAERPLALDRAELLCRGAAGAINELWRGEQMPELLAELVDDSRAAFELAANSGVEWVVGVERLAAEHPGVLCERLRAAGFAGDVFVGGPGVELFGGAPCAFVRAPGGAAPAEQHAALISKFLGSGAAGPERCLLARQVYRQFDFASGSVVRDLVAPMAGEPQAGQPMLVLAMEGGEPATMPPGARTRRVDAPVWVEHLEMKGE